MNTRELFEDLLAANYVRLFESDPEYAYSAARTTPKQLAAKMVTALIAGTANKDGKAIKATCKSVGIKHTYKAIREYLA